jgi:hypothetical protein
VLTGREGRTPKCPLADRRAVVGSNVRKRKGHQNVHWQIGLLPRATFKQRGKDPKCPSADRAVVGSNVRKRKGHQNVQGRIRRSLGARTTFKRGKDTETSVGR